MYVGYYYYQFESCTIYTHQNLIQNYTVSRNPIYGSILDFRTVICLF